MEARHYPFGMQMEGSWSQSNSADPDNNYLYNGKELDQDFGLDWYHYGARMYDAQIGRFTSIDPLAGDFASWSPFNYTYNNPIRFIDPDGKSPDDTIFFDEDGNELYRSRDNLPDAISIVSNGNLSSFNNQVSAAVLSPDFVTDDEVADLRNLGTSYLVGGMEKLYEKSMSETIDNHSYIDENYNPRTDIHPESGSSFFNGPNGKEVDLENAYSSSSDTNIGLDNDRTTIHTHPDNGLLIIKTPSGGKSYGTEKPGPSHKRDLSRNYGRGHVDFVIVKDNIYIYKYYKVGSVSRKFFKE